jgi:hypothetical protein
MILRSSVKAVYITDILHIGEIPIISIVYRWTVIIHLWVITTHSKEEKNEHGEESIKNERSSELVNRERSGEWNKERVCVQ